MSDISKAARDLATARERVAAAEEKLARVIRIALHNGLPATEIAELAGISRQRVYQIRDGKR